MHVHDMYEASRAALRRGSPCCGLRPKLSALIGWASAPCPSSKTRTSSAARLLMSCRLSSAASLQQAEVKRGS